MCYHVTRHGGVPRPTLLQDGTVATPPVAATDVVSPPPPLPPPPRLQGQTDATWVFLGWEGIMAQRAGFELNAFCPNDFKVPYGYSPVLVAHPDTLRRVPGRGGGEGGDH